MLCLFCGIFIFRLLKAIVYGHALTRDSLFDTILKIRSLSLNTLFPILSKEELECGVFRDFLFSINFKYGGEFL